MPLQFNLWMPFVESISTLLQPLLASCASILLRLRPLVRAPILPRLSLHVSILLRLLLCSAHSPILLWLHFSVCSPVLPRLPLL